MKHHFTSEHPLILHHLSGQDQPQPDTRNKKTLLWRSRAVGLLAALSLISRIDWQKNQPQQNVKSLPPQPTTNGKPTPQVGTMRKRTPRLVRWLSQFGNPTTSPANQDFTHGAILFFLSQPLISHNTAQSYFLWNNVEEKITERRFVAAIVLFIFSPALRHTNT